MTAESGIVGRASRLPSFLRPHTVANLGKQTQHPPHFHPFSLQLLAFTLPLVVSRWVRFPKRTHRKIVPSQVLTLWRDDGCAQNALKKRWVRFAKTMVCKPSIYHKRPFTHIAPPQTCGLVILPVAAALCRRVWPFTAFSFPFSKNCPDNTPSEVPCPAKLSLYDTIPTLLV